MIMNMPLPLITDACNGTIEGDSSFIKLLDLFEADYGR